VNAGIREAAEQKRFLALLGMTSCEGRTKAVGTDELRQMSAAASSEWAAAWLEWIIMFSPQVLDHFQNPRNAGEVEGASAIAELENPVCGDVLRLTARIVDGRLEEIRFLAKGCVASMACASQLVELVRGQTVAEARALRREVLIKQLGGLPEASTHAGHLAIDPLRKLLASA